MTANEIRIMLFCTFWSSAITLGLVKLFEL